MLCWQMLIAFWRPLSEWVFSQLALALSIERLQPACQDDSSDPMTSISWRGGYFYKKPDSQVADGLGPDLVSVELKCYLWSGIYPAILAAETLDSLSVRLWCRFAAGIIAICPSRRVNIAFRSSR